MFSVAVIVREHKVPVVGQFRFGGLEALVYLVHVPLLGCRDVGDELPDAFSREAWPAFEVALLDRLYPCADDGGEQAGMIECDKLVCVFAFKTVQVKTGHRHFGGNKHGRKSLVIF